jgi:hypothetical protein
MRDALHFLVSSDIPAQHKRILIEVVAQAMRDDDAAALRCAALLEIDAAAWQPHEATTIQLFLQGKIARTWQHADEILMRLATELHRKPANVRTKATELGFGMGVDYRLAQEHVRSQAQREAEREAEREAGREAEREAEREAGRE